MNPLDLLAIIAKQRAKIDSQEEEKQALFKAGEFLYDVCKKAGKELIENQAMIRYYSSYSQKVASFYEWRHKVDTRIIGGLQAQLEELEAIVGSNGGGGLKTKLRVAYFFRLFNEILEVPWGNLGLGKYKGMVKIGKKIAITSDGVLHHLKHHIDEYLKLSPQVKNPYHAAIYLCKAIEREAAKVGLQITRFKKSFGKKLWTLEYDPDACPEPVESGQHKKLTRADAQTKELRKELRIEHPDFKYHPKVDPKIGFDDFYKEWVEGG